MIDTIRFECDRPYNPAVKEALEGTSWPKSIAPDWKAPFHRGTYHEGEKSAHGGKAQPIRFIHEASGAKLKGDKLGVKTVEVSLPRLLHGSNGRLIKSPAELDNAWDRLKDILSEISIPEEPILDLLRLDLVWNIHFENPREVLLFFRNATWPKVRKDTAVYSLQDEYQKVHVNGVRFAGKDIVLQLYDKKAEMKGKHKLKDTNPSHCLRVEVQLKSKDRIRKEFGEDDMSMIRVDGSGFSNLYNVYLRLVGLLQPETLHCPEPGIDMDSLLAMGEVYHQILEIHNLAGEVPWGRSPFELYAAEGHKSETIAKRRIRMDRLKFKLAKFDWNEHLPESGLPAGIDIYPDGREVAVPSHCSAIPETWQLPHGS